MSSLKSRIAVAAVLAALSVPALAEDAPACAVCGDPTWPTLDAPAPQIALSPRGGEGEALRRADPTWPEVASALPSMQLVPNPVDGPQLDPAEPFTPEVNYALELGAPPAPRIAAK